jgi:predicted DNA-binding transcriptional regulator AlpA
MADEVFVTYPELQNHGVPEYSRKHLLDMQRRGQFPRAVQLSPNRVAWRLSEINRWFASRPVATAAARPDKRPSKDGHRVVAEPADAAA